MAAVAADKDGVIFIFESIVREHHIYFKKFGLLTIEKMLGLAREPEQMTRTGTDCVLNTERGSHWPCNGVSLSRSA